MRSSRPNRVSVSLRLLGNESLLLGPAGPGSLVS